jgi:hypothetical protein
MSSSSEGQEQGQGQAVEWWPVEYLGDDLWVIEYADGRRELRKLSLSVTYKNEQTGEVTEAKIQSVKTNMEDRCE